MQLKIDNIINNMMFVTMSARELSAKVISSTICVIIIMLHKTIHKTAIIQGV